MAPLRPSFLLLASLSAVGCADWPTYAHLPADPIQAAPAGTDPSKAVDFPWTAAQREADPGNETPPALVTLNQGEGVVIFGALSGVGWDPTVVVDHTATCDDVVSESEFPPLDQGAYTGDLDWFGLLAGEGGLLCAVLEIDLPEDTEVVSYDMLAYDLDECSNPISGVDDDAGSPLGLGLYQESASWQVEVAAGDRLGVLLAGFIPAETLDVEIPWRLGLAILPTEAEGGSGVCPALPEAS